MAKVFGVWLALLAMTGCTPQAGEAPGRLISGAADPPTTSTSDAEDLPDEVASEDAATAAELELVSISAQTWTILSGEHICADESSMKRSCVQVSDDLYPSSGNLFLDVQVELNNRGSEAENVSAGELIANLHGRELHYRLAKADDSQSTDIQPLGNATLHAQYEVPVEVLNSARFSVDLGARDPVPFQLETPEAQNQRKAQARADELVKEQDEKARDREDQARYEKCWSLNDSDSPMVSQSEFGWYVDNCASMYNVGDYASYTAGYTARHSI